MELTVIYLFALENICFDAELKLHESKNHAYFFITPAAPPSSLGPGIGQVHQMLIAAFIIEDVAFLAGSYLVVLCLIL